MFGGSLCKGGELLAMSAGSAILAAVLIPNFLAAREQGQLTTCKSNLKNIATACEMWAEDHGGHYPDRMESLWTATQMSERYLPSAPICPRLDQGYRYRLEQVPDSDFKDYVVTCPDGTAHRLPNDEPRYSLAEGLVASNPTGGESGFVRFAKDMIGVAVFVLSLGLFLASLARRPDPSPQVAIILDRSPVLAWLSCASWFLLVGGAVMSLMMVTSGLPLPLLRLPLACWLAGLFCEAMVKLGYRAWEILGPVGSRAGPEPGRLDERPGLGGGQRSVLLPSPGQRSLARVVSLGLPALVATAIVALPVLEPDPALAARGSFLGLGVAALLSVPLAMWGKSWARTLTRRELEWVPGTDCLVEHRLDGTRARALGTVAEIEKVTAVDQGYEIVIGRETFMLPPGELGAGLAALSST